MLKVLIVRFSSIGDIVLTSPVIRCIKTQRNDVEIHYLTKNKFSSILEFNPYLDKLYTISAGVSEVIGDLKNEKYDFVIDLHNNIRSRVLRAVLGVKTSSYKKLNLYKWLLVNLKINKLPEQHIVDRYMDAALFLGIKNDNQGLDFFVSKSEKQLADLIPSAYLDGYVGLSIGGQHFTKRLPADKLISICKQIKFPIVLLGGNEDRDVAEKVIHQSGNDQIFNACGIFSLNQSAVIVKEAKLMISNDTGLMHIAAAFKKEILSVWGNTVPEFGMTPYMAGPHSRVFEVKGLPCRPCSKIGFAKCPKKYFYCMNLIDENDLVDVANQLIREA